MVFLLHKLDGKASAILKKSIKKNARNHHDSRKPAMEARALRIFLGTLSLHDGSEAPASIRVAVLLLQPSSARSMCSVTDHGKAASSMLQVNCCEGDCGFISPWRSVNMCCQCGRDTHLPPRILTHPVRSNFHARSTAGGTQHDRTASNT